MTVARTRSSGKGGRLGNKKDRPGRVLPKPRASKPDHDAGRSTAHELSAEERPELTLHSLADAVLTADLHGRVIDINPMAESLTGWKLDESRGRPLRDIVHLVAEDTRRALSDLSEQVIHRRAVVNTNAPTLLVARDGAERPVAGRGAPLLDRQGHLRGTVIVLHDQTAERAAKSALERKERDLRQVIERSPNWVAITRDDRFCYVNSAFAGLLGYTAEELTGRELLSVFPVEDRPSARQRLERLCSGEPVTERLEQPLEGKDGRTALVEITGTVPIEFEGQAAMLMVGVDVSERRKLERQLLLADRMASMGTLAAGVAHEINNPLAFAMAHLELVRRDLSLLETECRDSPETATDRACHLREMVDAACEGAERVRIIVRDLRTFSRTDEDSVGLVDVRRVLDASVALVWNEIKHRAQLLKDYGLLPLVRGNEAKIGQLFLNLLVNAVQAIPEGQADRHEIRIVGRAHDPDRLVVDVRDTGAGIPPENLSRIFDPFFTTKPVGVGTGLGLAVCHSIVGALGGEIAVESAVGRGTTFRVTLPQAFPEDMRPPEVTPAAPPAARRGRILVIDDEEMIVSAVHEALREHEVVVETEGKSALRRLLDGQRFDLVLCDLMMPEMSGMDLYTRVKEQIPEQAERFVFMTGGAFTPRSRSFLASVPNLRLEKPFELQHLLSLVREHLRERAPAPTEASSQAPGPERQPPGRD